MSDFQSPLLKRLYEQMDTLDELYELIERSIAEEPPLTLHDGGILKEGYNEEVDRLRKAKTDGKSWLAVWGKRAGENRNQESENQI